MTQEKHAKFDGYDLATKQAAEQHAMTLFSHVVSVSGRLAVAMENDDYWDLRQILEDLYRVRRKVENRQNEIRDKVGVWPIPVRAKS